MHKTAEAVVTDLPDAPPAPEALVPMEVVEVTPEPFDPRRYLEDGFRDAFFRSQEIRGQLWGLKDAANVKMKDILELPADDSKTLPTQFAAAKYVLDTNIIKYPDVSHRTVEMQDNRTPKGMQPYRAVTREEVIEAAVIAIEAEDHRGDEQDGDTEPITKSG
jgi:hypothetical protein